MKKRVPFDLSKFHRNSFLFFGFEKKWALYLALRPYGRALTVPILYKLFGRVICARKLAFRTGAVKLLFRMGSERVPNGIARSYPAILREVRKAFPSVFLFACHGRQ